MAFTDLEQAEMMAEISTHQAAIGLVSISVDFSLESEPVMFNDGSYEMGKPYCIATRKDVADNGIVHGSMLTIDAVAWFVIGVQIKRTGFYSLTLSKTP
jgi:hypothetical protein